MKVVPSTMKKATFCREWQYRTSALYIVATYSTTTCTIQAVKAGNSLLKFTNLFPKSPLIPYIGSYQYILSCLLTDSWEEQWQLLILPKHPCFTKHISHKCITKHHLQSTEFCLCKIDYTEWGESHVTSDVYNVASSAKWLLRCSV